MSNKYQSHYSEQKFWNKLKSLTKLYQTLKEQAILLWLVLKEDDVPIAIKATVIGALGYLISPIDAVPDFLPLGLLDDGAVLSATLMLVEAYTTESMRQKARNLSK